MHRSNISWPKFSFIASTWQYSIKQTKLSNGTVRLFLELELNWISFTQIQFSLPMRPIFIPDRARALRADWAPGPGVLVLRSKHSIFTKEYIPKIPEHMVFSQETTNMRIQYRLKVSYHPSPRFSRDETLVSQEPLKRIFWNTLQAVSLRENDEFLATRWSLPCESIWYFGNCLTCCFKRNECRLRSKKPKWI